MPCTFAASASILELNSFNMKEKNVSTVGSLKLFIVLKIHTTMMYRFISQLIFIPLICINTVDNFETISFGRWSLMIYKVRSIVYKLLVKKIYGKITFPYLFFWIINFCYIFNTHFNLQLSFCFQIILNVVLSYSSKY